jgi:hypothetical protein
VRPLAILLLLAACRPGERAADTPGAALERAAIARGLVSDPKAGSLTGSWASEADRLCVVPAGGSTRIGVSIDYGDGQGCAAKGSVERDGESLAIAFGECRVQATFDGERIVFPAALPAACDRVCTGRASLSALTVERLSESASEASTLRSARGELLCGN